MKRGKTNSTILALIVGSLSILITTLPACTVPDNDTDNDTMNEKVSSQLIIQVNLRKEQIASPTSDRLEMMKNLGMSVDNLEIQRIFIHSTRELSPLQIKELEALGITIYQDSWIPPAGNHPTGFVLADMPVNSLGELAEFEYVVRLETAERQLQPQNGAKPQ